MKKRIKMLSFGSLFFYLLIGHKMTALNVKLTYGQNYLANTTPIYK